MVLVDKHIAWCFLHRDYVKLLFWVIICFAWNKVDNKSQLTGISVQKSVILVEVDINLLKSLEDQIDPCHWRMIYAVINNMDHVAVGISLCKWRSNYLWKNCVYMCYFSGATKCLLMHLTSLLYNDFIKTISMTQKHTEMIHGYHYC